MAMNGSNSSQGVPVDPPKIYNFGQFQLDTGQRLLTRSGTVVRLKPKTFEVLECLLQRNNEVVGKAHLIERVWPDSFVEDANLTVHISALRKIFAEAGDQAISIQTFPKVGYRLSADVQQNSAFVDRTTRDRDDPDSSVRTPALRSILKPLTIVAFVLIGGITLALSVYNLLPSPALSFLEKNTVIARSTNIGEVIPSASVSPDGRYLVYARDDGQGGFSIRLQMVGSNSETEVIPPTKGAFYGAHFLPDGNSIVYGATLSGEKPTSFVVPILGGYSKRLPLTRATNLRFAPDGQRLAYLYNELPAGKTHLVTANADGTDERFVITRQAPNYFWTGISPSWSPDGRRVVCIAQNATESFPRLVEIDIETGVETQITGGSWSMIRGVEWLRDGSGFIIAAAPETSSQFQIWHLSYPDASPTKITNDPVSYSGVSISDDGKVLVTTEERGQSSIWVAPVTGTDGGFDALSIETSQAQKISQTDLDGRDPIWGIGDAEWTPEGDVVFVSEEAGNIDIWKMNSDGSKRRQLTNDQRVDTAPAVSPDGQTIAFMSYRDGTESIWLMDKEGANQRRVTFDLIERFPIFSPDGKWIYFSSWKTGKALIWRIPVEGGDMENVVPVVSFEPSISRDGRWLIYSMGGEATIRDLTGEQPERKISLGGWGAQWSPITNVISYRLEQKPQNYNVWLYNIDDGRRRQLTDYTENGVFDYKWSPDGSKVLLVRASVETDVVVMKAK